MRPPYRIVLADNHPASATELRAALETQSDLTVAAAVTCASCSFTAVSAQKPDLVLLNLSMPAHRVLELVNDLMVLHPEVKLLIVSSHEQALETERVLRAGAHGCVTTSSSVAAKINAVRQVLAGKHCFSSQPTPGLHRSASCLAMTS
jgi:DNA-binding NarL/FixJ family response regulator